MSVTFSIESLPTGRWIAECIPTDTTTVYATEAEARVATVSHALQCEDCAVYGMIIHPEVDMSREYEVNMANANAVDVLRALDLPIDFEEGLCGSLQGGDLLGRVLVAMGTVEDSAIATVEVARGWAGNGNGPRMIDCGREAGYVNGKLIILHKIAEEAARLDRTVYWG